MKIEKLEPAAKGDTKKAIKAVNKINEIIDALARLGIINK